MKSYMQEICQKIRDIEGINAKNENKNNKSVEKMDRSKAKKKGPPYGGPKEKTKTYSMI